MLVDTLPRETNQCLFGIGPAVKSQYSTVRGKCGSEEQIKGESPHRVSFETANPLSRPPINLFHGVGQKRLLRSKAAVINRPVFFGQKTITDVLRLTSLKSKRR
jgi:hypothetical protein